MSDQLLKKYIDILNEMSAQSGRSGSDHSGTSGRSAYTGRTKTTETYGSGISGRSGSGLHSGSGSAVYRPPIKEKWGTETRVSPEERGKYAGKTKAELLKQYNALKASGPHKQGSKEFGRMRELAFAIRAKTGWGKVGE